MTSRRPGWSGYRGAALLAGLVVLGWLWDLALGGGRAHAPGWLGALLVVGGIGLLAARAATPDTGAEAPPPAPRSTAVVIEPATPADLPRLVEVEVAADTLFEVAGYGRTPGPASPAELAAAELLLVARRVPEPAGPAAQAHPIGSASSADRPDPIGSASPADRPDPIGCARVELVDGQPHLEGLSVRPRDMRQGVGTALVDAACRWAAERGYRQITLCTFADVPWNGPFYAKLGFTELTDLPPALRELREREARLGLDAMGRRCVLHRALEPAAGGPGSPAGRPDLPIS